MQKFDNIVIIMLGSPTNEYSSALTSLEKEQFLGKLVVMEDGKEPSVEPQHLFLPSLKLEGLFMDRSLSHFPKKLMPLTMSTSKSVTTNGGLISPRSPSNSSSSGSKKSIDPSLVSHTSMFVNKFAYTGNPQASSQAKPTSLQ